MYTPRRRSSYIIKHKYNILPSISRNESLLISYYSIFIYIILYVKGTFAAGKAGKGRKSLLERALYYF